MSKWGVLEDKRAARKVIVKAVQIGKTPTNLKNKKDFVVSKI